MAARLRLRVIMAAHLEKGPRRTVHVPEGPMTPAHTEGIADTWCGRTFTITSTQQRPERTKCQACAVAYTEATSEPAGLPAGFLVSADEMASLPADYLRPIVTS